MRGSTMTKRTGRSVDITRLVISSSLLIAAAGCSGTAPEHSTAPTAIASPTTEGTSSDFTRIHGVALGSGDYPAYTVDVPGTWSSADGHFVVKNGAPVLGLSVWDVGTVSRDPCHWRGNAYDPGPTVDDLVDALTAQRLRHATTPTDVTLAGYPGRYLEWSVPTDMVVTGDANFEGCDMERSNGDRYFVSWTGNGLGERYQQVAGQIDQLWILDVDGQRLLVDATYSPDVTKQDRDELDRVVDSLRFVDTTA
jgi:hypothetical protein